MSALRDKVRHVPGAATLGRLVRSASLGFTLPRSPFVSTFPPGTFYSPLPSRADLPASDAKSTHAIPGVDLREKAQLALLDELARTYAELPFSDQPAENRRFHLDNEWFAWCDAIVLYAILRHYRPRRVVEVGSGYSSAVMLDTRELFLDRETHFTFIDPYPERLQSLLRPSDHERCDVIARKVQDVDYAVFDALERNDILFIDSSHVVKVCSDVAHIVFNILPRLASGVLVHFHDVPWPFEYPLTWLNEGRAWNEAYFLRSFLQYNTEFEILFFNDFMTTFHADTVRNLMPAALNPSSHRLTLPASSLWIVRR